MKGVSFVSSQVLSMRSRGEKQTNGKKMARDKAVRMKKKKVHNVVGDVRKKVKTYYSEGEDRQ